MGELFHDHPNLDETILDVLNTPSLDLSKVALGTTIRLDLAEGDDLRDQLQLIVSLEEGVETHHAPGLRVLEGTVPPAVIEKNANKGLRNPDFVGELLVVLGACTYRHGYIPPITLSRAHSIDRGRHLETGINYPPGSEFGSMVYIPFVRDFAVIDQRA